MIYLQLFLSFLQIGMFSFGGGYAASSGAACCPERLAERTGICRSCDHCGNDAGSHCSEFRHLRGTEDCRDSRSCGGNGRVYSAVLHYCDDPGKTIPEVS